MLYTSEEHTKYNCEELHTITHNISLLLFEYVYKNRDNIPA